MPLSNSSFESYYVLTLILHVAKNRRDSSHDTELGSQNRDSAQRHEVNPPSEDREPSISSHGAIIPLRGESNLELNNERDRNESGEWGSERLVHTTLSEQLMNARNNGESHHENGELSDGDLLKAEEASISSSSHEAIIPSSGECVIDPDVEKDQDESGSEQLVRRKLGERQKYARNNDKPRASDDGRSGFPNQVYYEEECSYHENGKIPIPSRDPSVGEADSISSPEATMSSSGECFIDPNDIKVQKDQNESGDCSLEQLADINSSECLKNAGSNDESRAFHDEQPGGSNQFYSRIEFASHGNAKLSGQGPTEEEETSTSSHEVITIPFSGESIVDPNDEKDRKEGDEYNRSEQLVQITSSKHQKNASNGDESPAPACHDGQSGFSDKAFFVNGVATCGNEKLPSGDSSESIDEILLLGEESPEADDRKKIHSNLECSGISNEVAKSSIITADTQVGTSISSKILAPLSERVKEPEETISHDLDHRNSVDNFECSEVNQCAEPSDALLGMVKSPTTKGSPAYDGSVSSYDGMDDQILDHRRCSSRNIHGASNFLTAVEGPKREESLVNSNAVARDSEIPIEARSSWKNLSREKHHDIEYHERSQNRRHDFSMQNRSRLRREKYHKLSLLGRDCHGGYENGSTSGSMFDESCDSRLHSSDNFADHDEEKVRLLRMVYELQDKLEKSCNLNGNGSGRVSMGSAQKDAWAPVYYDHRIPQEESWHDSEYPSYSQRNERRTSYPGHNSLSRMTSGAKTVSGPQINRFGMEHFPDNCPHSMQLLPSERWHNRGSRMAHIDHDYYSSYSSCPSSPQHFLSTQLSARGSHMQSHLSHRNHERNYLREKNRVVKHHLRPMAGGAPFITCYYCLKLLQIPAEFLLLKRRCNQLKCGHCSKILEFSLESRTHIVPYAHRAAELPPSETNECDDYALAIGKSGSREIDDSIVFPHPPRRDMDMKFKNLKTGYQSGEPSSHAYKADKYSSEVRKHSTLSNSPLHRLMGYSSPSQVIRGLVTSRSLQRKN